MNFGRPVDCRPPHEWPRRLQTSVREVIFLSQSLQRFERSYAAIQKTIVQIARILSYSG